MCVEKNMYVIFDESNSVSEKDIQDDDQDIRLIRSEDIQFQGEPDAQLGGEAKNQCVGTG